MITADYEFSTNKINVFMISQSTVFLHHIDCNKILANTFQEYLYKSSETKLV